jgi:ribosome-binding ATPase YchF (GTP1/OBG family)
MVKLKNIFLSRYKMSSIDSEIEVLQSRLRALEEKKKEEERNKLEPMVTLQEYINENKKQAEFACDSHQRERQKVARRELRYLEPVLLILKNIEKRLDYLESK